MYYLPVLLIITILMCKNYIHHRHPVPEQATLERKPGSQEGQPHSIATHAVRWKHPCISCLIELRQGNLYGCK